MIQTIQELLNHADNKKNIKSNLDYYLSCIGNGYTWNTYAAFMTVLTETNGYFVVTFANNNRETLDKEIAATESILEAELYEVVQMKELFPVKYEEDLEEMFVDARRYVEKVYC